MTNAGTGRPGSHGEHELQERTGNAKRAKAFYDNQVLDHLTPVMREFMARMQMAFIATSDAHGDCDSTFRAGPPGFVRVLDEKTVMWPEYKGNGVMASMGNILENGHVGILFVDFFETAVGLHVNGRASIVENAAMEAFGPLLDRLEFATPAHEAPEAKKTPERWVVVQIDEAYIHCSKHIPMLEWASEEAEAGRRAGDVFKAKDGERAWLQPACEVPARGGGARRDRRGDHRLRGTGSDAQPVGPPPPAADPQVSASARARRAARRAWRSGSGVRTLRAIAIVTWMAVSVSVRQAAWTAIGRAPAGCAARRRRPRRRFERRVRAALLRRQRAVGDERAVRDADRRQAEHVAEVEGEAGAPRMVAAGGVDDQHVRAVGEAVDRVLQRRAGAQREQAGLVGAAGLVLDRHDLRLLAGLQQRRGGPRGVARVALAGLVGGEADEAAGDAQIGRGPDATARAARRPAAPGGLRAPRWWSATLRRSA